MVKVKNIRTLTIDRSKWGVGARGRALRVEESGLQCCLGFAARRMGASVADITNKGMPCNIESLVIRRGFPQWMENDVTSELQEINDNSKTSKVARERRIASKFLEVGVKVKFVGKYA